MEEGLGDIPESSKVKTQRFNLLGAGNRTVLQKQNRIDNELQYLGLRVWGEKAW